MPALLDFDLGLYSAMSGASRDSEPGAALKPISPLNPNIVGEFFALAHIGRGTPHQVGGRAAIFREAAWRWTEDGNFGFGDFLARALCDFPNHAAFPSLAVEPEVGYWQRFMWRLAITNVTVEAATAVIEYGYSVVDMGRNAHALQAASRVHLYAMAMELDKAREIYGDLCSLCRALRNY